MLAEMVAADGKPKTRERVWISSIGYAGSDTAEQTVKLTGGLGATPEKIGPEFTFGIYMAKSTDAPTLLIKTAWGGKSLNTDFRPPSACPDEFNESQFASFGKQGKDLNAPKLPFVIGVLGVGGRTSLYGPDQKLYQATHQHFRDAMAAPAQLPEAKGNVAAVRTEKFRDLELTAAKAKDNAIKQQAKQRVAAGKLKPAEEKAELEKMRTAGLTERARQILEQGISNLEFHYLGSAKILGAIGARGWSDKDRNRAYDQLGPVQLLERLGSRSPIARDRAAMALGRRKGEPPVAALVRRCFQRRGLRSVAVPAMRSPR
jgi:hypothetical protein